MCPAEDVLRGCRGSGLGLGPEPPLQYLPSAGEPLPHDIRLVGLGKTVLVEEVRRVPVDLVEQVAQPGSDELVEELFQSGLQET
jgi:hypothetical protein